MVESTLINRTENRTNLNDIQNDGIDIIEESLNFFIKAIEETDDLTIVGTSFNKEKKEIFLIEDINNSKEHIEVVISEIIEKAKDVEIAKEFINVIKGERSSIILNGVTRIVGYFSRVNNWNRSKIGELRDRRIGEYSVSNS
ncbi:MAG: hypothetical protein ACUZ8E_06335 [Candidatus Anammoxibacter sp.]